MIFKALVPTKVLVRNNIKAEKLYKECPEERHNASELIP